MPARLISTIRATPANGAANPQASPVTDLPAVGAPNGVAPSAVAAQTMPSAEPIDTFDTIATAAPPNGGTHVLDRIGAALAPTPVAPSAAGPVIELAAMEAAGLVVGRKARSRVSEEFRITTGQILAATRTWYTPGRGAGNVLMVTSARPGEGKTFTALNLAASIAMHTHREVLLVDVDSKANALSDQLGVGARVGVVDLAANASLRIEDLILRTCFDNLQLLPVGHREAPAADVASTGTKPISALVERLGRRFPNHLVILDAPPALSTSDPSTLASVVGQIVLVVEAEKTQRAEVLAALDLVKACASVTLMLNKITASTSYTFGAYNYFGKYA